MRSRGLEMRITFAAAVLASIGCGSAASPELTIEIKDYAAMPISGAVDGPGNSAGLLARINFLREEPGGGKKRFFVNDLNGPLYIVDGGNKEGCHLSGLQRASGQAGDLPPSLYRSAPGQRVHQLRLRPRLRSQRQVLYDPPRRPRAACIRPAR